MNMKTVENLQDALQQELAWRKKEISDIRASTVQADDTDKHVFRSGQVLLCAHWEGFLKKGVEIYLDHVFCQDIKLCDCNPNIIAIMYFKDVISSAEAKYPGSPDHHIRLANKIVASINSKITKPSWNLISNDPQQGAN